MPEHRMDPAALVWNWRRAEGKTENDEAKRNAAARRKGVIGGVVGLTVAAIIYFYFERPILAAVVAGIALVLTLLAFLAPTAHRKVAGTARPLRPRRRHGRHLGPDDRCSTTCSSSRSGSSCARAGSSPSPSIPTGACRPTGSSTEDRPWTAESYRKQF